MDVFTETGRLRLRRFTAADAGLLVALDADPEVMRFINGGRATPRDQVTDEILPRLLADYGRFGGLGVWVAVEKATGAELGWFELRPRDTGPPDEAELGYRLLRAAWGRGLATEGSRELVRKGFTEFGLRRIFAVTMTVNRASRRVMEKSGLTYVRSFHDEWPEAIEGGEHGDVEYAVEAEEWAARG